MNVLCGVQFGTVHAGPFFILPKAPVISYEKDWGLVPPAVVKALNAERSKRHPGVESKDCST